MLLYHGTDLDSAARLLAGEQLSVAAAALRKIDGPAGFFLAIELGDSEFFAARRSLRGATVIAYNVSDDALAQLFQAGGVRRAIPRSRQSPAFAGDELFVPTTAFATFNRLLSAGEIRVSPA